MTARLTLGDLLYESKMQTTSELLHMRKARLPRFSTVCSRKPDTIVSLFNLHNNKRLREAKESRIRWKNTCNCQKELRK